jgi:tRNA(fMet)-specific endonuclease VapC
MSTGIIADTSVWIEYFKGNSRIADFLDENLINDRIYINGIIIAELIQGIKVNREREVIRSCIDAVSYIEMTYNDWVFAGDLSSELRKKGITIPLTDIAISAMAINNNMSIATLDRHFNQIPGVDLYPEEL